ncbi:TIR domain-containing protein [uncultured Lacinutrix sp.]|uniref:TIR domain-containing protein n=1 Tax=uncultured Lacinutrix sp. TaxID=574032 RepID=UPI00260BE493|nr:TIR domain-containing protein [uncultured Lacinutrix sp.]
MTNKEDNKVSIGNLIIGSVVLGIVLYNIFKPKKETKTVNSHKNKKRVFISFSMKDEIYRDYLVEQAQDNRSPFEFVDMSVKKPWPKPVWKEKCRKKIKGCDGVLILLSGKTWNSQGARWEVKCAKEENIPVVGMHIFKNNQKSILPELNNSKIISWKWKELERIVKSF